VLEYRLTLALLSGVFEIAENCVERVVIGFNSGSTGFIEVTAWW
jgi:hypothetical protein